VRQRLQVVDVAAGRLTVLALLEQQLVANLQATASKSKATPLATVTHEMLALAQYY
jgi:hypothetical protein